MSQKKWFFFFKASLTNIVFDLVNLIKFLIFVIERPIFVISFRKLAELDPPIYLTEEEIENYKEAFVDYDVDGSGNINILGIYFSRYP